MQDTEALKLSIMLWIFAVAGFLILLDILFYKQINPKDFPALDEREKHSYLVAGILSFSFFSFYEVLFSGIDSFLGKK